jgi:hypothetical protein
VCGQHMPGYLLSEQSCISRSGRCDGRRLPRQRIVHTIRGDFANPPLKWQIHVFKTALAQLRIAASVGLGRPFAQWSLDHLIDAIKETRREFGAIDVEDGGSQPGGPVLDEETRRELHLPRFRTQAVRSAQETSYYAHLFERLDLEPDRLSFEDFARLPLTKKESLRQATGIRLQVTG